MPYYTTMNLPAPSYERFREKLSHYESAPKNAIQDFEEALKCFFKVEAVATFTNCFTALAMALLYAVRSHPKTVAVAGLAYRRTTDIVQWAGLHPIYVDNNPQNLGMSLPGLEEKLKAGGVGCVLMQHPMVKICDPGSYIALCEKYGVPVVFDSVEATGGMYEGKRIGGFGMVEGFSLHPSKVINAAEGGVLTFGSAVEHRAFMSYMRDIGVMEAQGGEMQFFGLEPLHAMMGLASLDAYPEMRAKFRTHYMRYRESLQGSALFRLVEYDQEADPNFKSVLVELRASVTGFREELIRHLEAHNIGARPYYAPLHPMTRSEALPVAKQLSERYIFLPIGHSVDLADIDFICKTLLAYPVPRDGG